MAMNPPKSVSREEFWSPAFRYREWYQGCKGAVKGNGTFTVEDVLAGLEATGAYVAEPKRDGIWCAAFFDGQRGNQFFSRTQELKPYSLDSLLVPAFDGCLLVGELGFGSQESLRRRALLGHDFVDCYDLLYHNFLYVGDLPGEERRSLLKAMFRHVFQVPRMLILTPRWTDGFVARYAAEPEGLIIKPAKGFPYVGGGEKVKHWMKVKKDHTVDMVVMGYELSTAETKAGKGMVEHLICGMYVNGALVELTRTGGMTHEMQLDIVANWHKYLGIVVELKHFGQFKSGALRHPSVVRFRTDKRASDCVFDPDELSHKSFKSL